MFCKIGVFRYFSKFTRKNLCRSVFFNRIASLQPVALLKETSSTGVFKDKFFIDYLRATASKYNVTFKELFSLIEL